MINEPASHERHPLETEITDRFLDNPDETSFTALFEIFSPQLVAFFRARSRDFTSAEDLAQEVMLTVYRKVEQARHRNSFRGWLFKIAHNVLCRHYVKSREVKTVNLTDVEGQLAAAQASPSAPLFEFRDWMSFPGCAGTRLHDAAVRGGMGIPRDRGSPTDSNRYRSMAHPQFQEEDRRASGVKSKSALPGSSLEQVERNMETRQSRQSISGSWMMLIGIVFAGPIVCLVDALAVWCLTGSLGFTHSFPWSDGPLANWLVWVALAFLLTFLTTRLRRQRATTQGQCA